MSFNIWQRYITNETGDIVPGAGVEVRDSATNSLAAIFSDDQGTPKNNPFVVGQDSLALFYANAGTYDITVTSGQDTSSFNDVQLGSTQSYDVGTGSGEIPTVEDIPPIVSSSLSTSSVTSFADVSNAGSGEIITNDERGKLASFIDKVYGGYSMTGNAVATDIAVVGVPVKVAGNSLPQALSRVVHSDNRLTWDSNESGVASVSISLQFDKVGNGGQDYRIHLYKNGLPLPAPVNATIKSVTSDGSSISLFAKVAMAQGDFVEPYAEGVDGVSDCIVTDCSMILDGA